MRLPVSILRYYKVSPLIWVWAVLSSVFIIISGCDNREFKPENRMVQLIGPVAYKGVDGQMVVEGIIQNNTDGPLERIIVIVSWYNKDRDFVGIMEKMIAQEIIPAHDSSSYRLEKEFDPRMNNYTVGFYTDDKRLLSVYHLQYGGQ